LGFLKSNCQKFKKHLKTGGLPYAFWRGIKYFIFLIKKQRDRFKHPPEIMIIKGKTKISYSGCGMNIFWNNREVTKGAGLNVAINTLGLWTDSTKADWQILEQGKDYFKVKVVFRDLPLSQIWILKINNEQEIDLQIDMEIEAWLHIDEFRLACLSNPNYKNWIVNYQLGDFPRLDNNWRDLYFSEQPASLVGLRFSIEDENLPPFVLETKNKDLLSFIQNPSIDNDVHIIGFRRIDAEEKKDYTEGRYGLFSVRINLFKDEHLLDAKIENLRQAYLEAEIEANTKAKKSKRRLKVLLVNLPWQRDGKWGVRAGSRWPHIKDSSEESYLPFPFFLAYATSLLQKHDINASMIDAIAEEILEDEFLEKISGMDFDYLLAETSIPSFYYDLYILKKISSLGIPIILCGPNSKIYQPRFLEEHPYINFVLYGEYEFTLLELVKSLQEHKDLSKVKGLIYNDNGTTKKNPPRDPFDIDLLPWPYRDGLPMYKYLDAPGEMLTPSVQILASRGCPFKCQFCLWPQVIYQGNHYRPRNILDVIDEMEYLMKEKGFKSVYFDDDTFNIGKERMLNFCREIRKRGLDKVQWAIMARPDLMDEELLEVFKKAGLYSVKYGVESAVQGLVDGIGKGMDLKKVEKIVRFTKKIGIKVHLTFAFGLPGETKQTIKETIKWVKAIEPFSVQFSIATPFPGTRYYDVLEQKGLIVSKDLSCYDGHFKSVMKSETLSPIDLELAKTHAYRAWFEHLRKKRGFLGGIKRFYYYTSSRGLGYARYKAINYLKNNLFKINKHLKPTSLIGQIGLLNKRFNNRNLSEIEKNYGDVKEILNPSCADILFIQCPPWDTTSPPLGIAYLSSYLKKYGYEISVFDLNIFLYHLASKDLKYLWEQKSYNSWVDDDLFKNTWFQFKEITNSCVVEMLQKVDVKYIGLSVNFASIKFVSELLKIIKRIKNEAKIILGGWGCINEHMRSLFPKEFVDVFVVGEGEETLREVIDVLEKRGKTSEVLGAIFNSNCRLAYKPRLPIADLDSIPWPTFSDFNLEQYTTPVLPLFTSRGCISGCSFCNDWRISKPYRYRSAQNVFEEIKYHIECNHIEVFSLKDLLCNGNIDRLNLLCDLIINSKIEIQWDSQAIPRKETAYELLRKLKKAGCATLIYGVESFSNNVLKQMKKIFTKEVAEKVIKDTHRAGINTMVNIIVGFPGETEKDFQETCEAIERNRKYIAQIGAISVCLVNNDSELEIDYQNYRLILPNDPKIRAKEWASVDGKNNYELRKKRAKEIIDLVNHLGLSYATATI